MNKNDNVHQFITKDFLILQSFDIINNLLTIICFFAMM